MLERRPAGLDEVRLLNLRLQALIEKAGGPPGKNAAVEDLFARSLKLEPKNINTNYLYARWLVKSKQFEKALLWYREIIARAPADIPIRQDYWKAIAAQPGRTEAQKTAETERELSDFLAAGPASPAAFAAAAQKYDELKNYAKRDALENSVLEKYPRTRAAETIAFNRLARILRSIEDEEAPAEEELRKLDDLCADFIRLPLHFDERKLGFVFYTLLVSLGRTKDVTDSRLAELIRGTLRYHREPLSNNNSTVAEILADGAAQRPGSRLNRLAEKYARAGIREAEINSPDDPPAKALFVRGQALNMLGHVLTGEKKYREAQKTLLAARQLFAAQPGSFFKRAFDAANKNYLAALYLAENKYDRAEELYLVSALADDSETRNFFSRLYEQKTGGSAGFEDYYQKIRGRLKERVLASRLAEPKEAAPFRLPALDGRTVSSAELKGRVLVINLWGTWCAPCVGEMPQLQKLYEHYRSDPAVAIITMDVDEDLDTARKFIAANGYEFPVLDGGSYKNNFKFGEAAAFPTTLFVDRSGRVAFVKIGASDALFEEFGWRIEALKNN